MHGPSLATMLVALLLGQIPTPPAGQVDALAEARRKLSAEDGVSAVAILEAALPEAGTSKENLLELLRKAYDSAAKQAQDAGRFREAETYRENLKILNRKARPGKGSAPATPPVPIVDPPEKPPIPVEAEPPSPEPSASSPKLLPDVPSTPPDLAPPDPVGTIEPTAPAARPSTADLTAADAAFVAKDYPEAGRIYDQLALEQRLPAERRDQWLYCRAFGVVARINARPTDDAQWASIRSEIDQIRALNPKNILGEYLRDLAVEKQAGRKKSKPAKGMVVRGSAPEEPPATDRPVRTASNVAATSASNPMTAPESAATRIGPNAGRWQTLDSSNFRIYHADSALAGKVAQAAEAARRDQIKKWARQPNSRTGWQPLCEIYLYPTAKQYAAMTGQPEDSPGFSTMGMNGGRITSRRINLRADHPTLLQAVLPHEITHVILADQFSEQQIPRWADEGIAVLAEPADEQRRRALDLVTPLADNRMFAVDVLMSMDYPDNRHWGLYYAQSVSLSRFLVEQGTPAQMIQFLQESQRDGYETALRRVYQIEGFDDLQRRWLTYARSKAETRGVATSPRPSGTDLKVR